MIKDHPISTTVWRKFNLATVVNQRRRSRLAIELQTADPKGSEWIIPPDDARVDLAREQVKHWGSPPSRYPLEHFEEVAEVYRLAFEAHLPPTAEVQSQLGATTRRQAAGWVQQARKRGLLPPTEPRKAKA